MTYLKSVANDGFVMVKSFVVMSSTHIFIPMLRLAVNYCHRLSFVKANVAC